MQDSYTGELLVTTLERFVNGVLIPAEEEVSESDQIPASNARADFRAGIQEGAKSGQTTKMAYTPGRCDRLRFAANQRSFAGAVFAGFAEFQRVTFCNRRPDDVRVVAAVSKPRGQHIRSVGKIDKAHRRSRVSRFSPGTVPASNAARAQLGS